MAAGGFWIDPRTGEPIIPFSNPGDSWYSDSWLDQAISGMDDLARDAWGGINDLGEKFFGGGPTDFSGQVNTMEDYARDQMDQYEDMIRNPVGYARDNPSATLASLVGLTAGGAGMASRALRGAAPSRVGGITSRLSNAQEAAAQTDFASTLARLINEERGGSAGPDPTGRAGEWFDQQLRAYQKNRQPEAGDIEDMSPEARNIRDMLAQTSLNKEGMQRPTMEGLLQEAIIDTQQRRFGGNSRALMEGVDNTGHKTPMNAQGGAGVTSIRQGRRVGGESQQWAPFDREVEAPDSKPKGRGSKWGGSKLRDDLNPDVNDIPDTRPGPHQGVFEYEAGVGIRDLMDNPPYRTIEDLFEHETDIGNIESIRAKGLEARFDPAEEGRKFVSARRRRADAEEPPEGRARVIFRSNESPMEREGLNAVKFREGISPEDIVDIIIQKKSTLQNLAEDVRRTEGRDLDPDFETKPTPAPARRRVPPKRTPPRPVTKNTSGPTPAEIAARKGRAI